MTRQEYLEQWESLMRRQQGVKQTKDSVLRGLAEKHRQEQAELSNAQRKENDKVMEEYREQVFGIECEIHKLKMDFYAQQEAERIEEAV